MNLHKNTRLPYKAYYLPVLLLCLAGVVDSLYLLYSHYQNYTNPTYSSFCAISRAINCDTVSQSPYAIFLDLPVALWGVLGYLLLLFLIGVSQYKKRHQADLWNLIFLLSIVYSISSVVLALVSSLRIHAWCIMCIFSYGINFGISFLSWIILRRFDTRGRFYGFWADVKCLGKHPLQYYPGVAAIICIGMMAWVYLPHYWELSPLDESDHLSSGQTAEGYPWIGAANSEITIFEFSDYMCFQCRKMHFLLRQLVTQYPQRIRLVHRHFPMDHVYNPLVSEPFHAGSGKMAIIALYAQEKEQFWEVNDLLFDLASQKKDFNTRTIAEKMNITSGELAAALSNKFLRLRLKHDIAVGIDHGISGTPSFIIGGNVYAGTIPKDVLQKMMSDNEK